MIGTTALIAIPIGVAAAAYLEEFASKKSRFAHFVELNVQNLAAVPAIIYGMLAAAAVVAIGIPRNTVIAGGIALALLILPVVIVSTREALRAVPQEIRQGSLALGATPMQTLQRQTLPAAVPGIATGTILALSRAIGEAAPLLLLGGLVFVKFDPNGSSAASRRCRSRSSTGPAGRRRRSSRLAAAASILLLCPRHRMNGVAIIIRNRYSTPDDRADTARYHRQPTRRTHRGQHRHHPDPPRPRPSTRRRLPPDELRVPPCIERTDVSVYYGDFRAVNEVTMDIGVHEITALIGPSGCGKSTVLRSLNRMNDLILGARPGGRSPTTARTSTGRTSTRSRSAAGSAWSSRSRTRSRSPSTTTSPTAPRSPG